METIYFLGKLGFLTNTWWFPWLLFNCHLLKKLYVLILFFHDQDCNREDRGFLNVLNAYEWKWSNSSLDSVNSNDKVNSGKNQVNSGNSKVNSGSNKASVQSSSSSGGTKVRDMPPYVKRTKRDIWVEFKLLNVSCDYISNDQLSYYLDFMCHQPFNVFNII